MNAPKTAIEIIECVTVVVMTIVSLAVVVLVVWTLIAYYDCSQGNCL